ncbi:BlyA family holin [Borrelia coriaceae]|uniref:BlyA family holin n=1 Tax=Borrelia coriaceae TaxID=144 RepID=UPI00046CB07B|nr:BlyA family holin [Borrelia coriaceae]
MNEVNNNLLDFLLQLISVNEVKLIIIGIFILGIGLIFKPTIKDMLNIIANKIKTNDKDKNDKENK